MTVSLAAVVAGTTASEDGFMLDRTTVWMVHLGDGDPSDVEGAISLEDDALVFEPRDKPVELRFPYARIVRVRRLRGSPVLLLEWTEDRVRRRTAFYFIQPPPLEPPDPSTLPASRSGRPLGPIGERRAASKRHHRRANASYLTVSASRMKPEVKAWTVELTSRVRATQR